MLPSLGMLAENLVRTAWGKRLVRRANATRAKEIVEDLQLFLPHPARLLDIGAGSCDVAALLHDLGWDVAVCDVRDLSCVPGLEPILFDGRTLPFAPQSFDVALLVNVLHHVSDPETSLSEAGRVARRVLVAEDVYETRSQKLLTMAMDTATNLEFLGHPHANRGG